VPHSDKGVGPARGYNIHKYLCTLYIGAPKYKKQILPDLKGDVPSNNNSRGF